MMEIGIDLEISSFILRGSLERDLETVNISILAAVKLFMGSNSDSWYG
jgi:hypothetical protein